MLFSSVYPTIDYFDHIPVFGSTVADGGFWIEDDDLAVVVGGIGGREVITDEVGWVSVLGWTWAFDWG